jgi:hypothetical protein
MQKMTAIKIDSIIRSKRRSIGLEIARDARLIVRAPKHVSLSLIEDVVYKKRTWIVKKQCLVRKRLDAITPKEFVQGEKFLYLGNEYQLTIINDKDVPFIFRDDRFQLSIHHLHDVRNLFLNWYRNEARWVIEERVRLYSSLSLLQYNRINITGAQRQWGSCGAHGSLNYTWRLIMAPLTVIDYVVVHELVHIKERNHSQRFWSKVSETVPDYRDRRDWLKTNGYTLTI